VSRARITEGVFQASPSYLIGVDGASVQVNARGAGAATVYRDETGPSTVANPLTTRKGRIEPVDQPGGDAWLDTGSYTGAAGSRRPAGTERSGGGQDLLPRAERRVRHRRLHDGAAVPERGRRADDRHRLHRHQR
jgi:hypothetical protein